MGKRMRIPFKPQGGRESRLALTRRQFIGAGAFALGALALPAGGLAENRAKRQISVAEAFDREIEKFMEIRKVPGGALTVVKDRRLVYARGYGWADAEK